MKHSEKPFHLKSLIFSLMTKNSDLEMWQELSIVLYDGECGLCNASVSFIWKNDPEGVFHFLPLQSEKAQSFLSTQKVESILLDTVYVYAGGQLYHRSDAAIEVLSALPSTLYRLSARLLRLIPRPVRDLGYSCISRNRQRFFKKTACEIPPVQIMRRFL